MKVFFENHPIVFYTLIWLGFGLVALLINEFIKEYIAKQSAITQLKINFTKSILWGLGITLVVTYGWFSVNGNPFNEFRLIEHGIKTKGQIYQVKQESDVIEEHEGRKATYVEEYYYKFSFVLPSGDTIYGSGKEGGSLPSELEEVDDNPQQVIIEYLPENPNVNRVSEMTNSNHTLYEWFRYNVLGGLILFIVSAFFGGSIIKNGLKEYRLGMQNLNPKSFYSNK